jgi:hypothetical protein
MRTNTNERLFHKSKEGFYSMSKRIIVYGDEGSSESDGNGESEHAANFEVWTYNQGASGRLRNEFRSGRSEGDQYEFQSAGSDHGRQEAWRRSIPEGSRQGFEPAGCSNDIAAHQRRSTKHRQSSAEHRQCSDEHRNWPIELRQRPL